MRSWKNNASIVEAAIIASMQRLTLFTWGYYGWGNATEQFIVAADAVEKGRGFRSPIFVDIRIRRSVRAAGFNGPAFERLLGQERHLWMKSLGNKFIETKTGPRIQIAEPSAAHDLLDLAVESAKSNSRLLFFCGCQWPRDCHRATVAKLVLAAAKKRGATVEIVEWPGGKPKRIDFEVTPATLAAVLKGKLAVPLEGCTDLAEVAGLAWGSIATLHSGARNIHRVVGPAVWKKGQWHTPLLSRYDDPNMGLADYKAASDVERHNCGLEPSSV